MTNNVFDWYKLICDLGDREDTDGRDLFFMMTKLHLVIIAGVLALGSYAITNEQPNIMYLAAVMSFFGAYNSFAWQRQYRSHSEWESRWRVIAAKFENTELFRNAVGVKAEEVSLWSDEEIIKRIGPDAKPEGIHASMYLRFIKSFLVLYIILSIGCIGFLIF